jgi:ParB/RepB/Spo0J family partition protein
MTIAKAKPGEVFDVIETLVNPSKPHNFNRAARFATREQIDEAIERVRRNGAPSYEQNRVIAELESWRGMKCVETAPPEPELPKETRVEARLDQDPRSSPRNDANANGEGEGQQGPLRIAKLTEIGRSPWNRNEFDQAKLEKLAATIKVEGIIQPLLVRKNPGYVMKEAGELWTVESRGGTEVGSYLFPAQARTACAKLNDPPYELVAGERRWRAAAIAGLKEAPIVLRDIASDRAAIELQWIENDDREGLSAIEEARKFEQLRTIYLKEGKSRTDSIGLLQKLCGRSEGTVRETLALLELPDSTQTLIARGLLPQSHAKLLVKLKDPKTIEAMAREWASKEPGQPAKVSFRNAELQRNDAVDREANLARYNATRAEFEAKGLRVLTGQDLKSLNIRMYEGGSAHVWGRDAALYVTAQDHVSGDSGYRTYKQLWKKAPAAILARAEDEKPVTLYLRAEADQAVKEGGKFKSNRGSSAGDARAKREAAEAKAKAKAEREELNSMLNKFELGSGVPPKQMWEWIAKTMCKHHLHHDTARVICQRRELDEKEHRGKYGSGHRSAVEAELKEIKTERGFQVLVMEMLIGGGGYLNRDALKEAKALLGSGAAA